MVSTGVRIHAPLRIARKSARESHPVSLKLRMVRRTSRERPFRQDPRSFGSLKDGTGEFYSEESVNDRTVLVRGTWSHIKPDSHHFQIDYSDDGGRTWEPVFLAELTRVKP